jgi:hypothetical protein
MNFQSENKDAAKNKAKLDTATMKKQNEPKIDHHWRVVPDSDPESSFAKQSQISAFLTKNQRSSEKQTHFCSRLRSLVYELKKPNEPKIERSEILHSFSDGGQIQS